MAASGKGSSDMSHENYRKDMSIELPASCFANQKQRERACQRDRIRLAMIRLVDKPFIPNGFSFRIIMKFARQSLSMLASRLTTLPLSKLSL
jgi:hypothetical protein